MFVSMAAMFLRETFLPCFEQQTEALTARLSSPLAFGPVSGWSADIFTEIGALAGKGFWVKSMMQRH